MPTFLDRFRRKKTGDEVDEASLRKTVADYPHLMAVKPMEGYIFRSDCFMADDMYACILAFFTDFGAQQGLPPFWGTDRIIIGLPEGVTTILFQQTSKLEKRWVENHLKSADALTRLQSGQAAETTSKKGRLKANRAETDIEQVNAELLDQAAYTHVQDRMLVRAPSRQALDDALDTIRRAYTASFPMLRPDVFLGEQRQELSTLFSRNERKRGHGNYFTSTELAGQYSLITHGLNDPDGEFVGRMRGEVDTSAINFAVDRYNHHVVVAMDARESTETFAKAYPSALWGSKLSQCAMLNNRRVVHIVLDGTNLDDIGPKFDSITYRLDMNRGDVNMFEIFGKKEDELNLFSAHQEKIVLMTHQLHKSDSNEKETLFDGVLKNILTDFYIDARMWVRNPQDHRDQLRLVGIPHEDVPRLDRFYAYVDEAERQAQNQTMNATKKESLTVLQSIFRNLLDDNADLFNVATSNQIDGASNGVRVIYDFGGLIQRSQSTAMAQLINVLGFAVSSLGEGDLIIFHGVDAISDDPALKKYIADRLSYLQRRGGRVAYLYNDITAMLEDTKFNHLDVADYSVLGGMNPNTVKVYEQKIGHRMPERLKAEIATSTPGVNYLRRGVDNVVFYYDIPLGVNPDREPVYVAEPDDNLDGAESIESEIVDEIPSPAPRAPRRAIPTTTRPKRSLVGASRA